MNPLTFIILLRILKSNSVKHDISDKITMLDNIENITHRDNK